jgi:hypothetical protein
MLVPVLLLSFSGGMNEGLFFKEIFYYLTAIQLFIENEYHNLILKKIEFHVNNFLKKIHLNREFVQQCSRY